MLLESIPGTWTHAISLSTDTSACVLRKRHLSSFPRIQGTCLRLGDVVRAALRLMRSGHVPL